jgi:hypothetical protein
VEAGGTIDRAVSGKLQRARSKETAQTGANRSGLRSRKAERAAEQVGEDAKSQVRNFDPGMELARARAVAGERKAVTSQF